MITRSKGLMLLLIFSLQQLTAQRIARTADEYAQLGWQAYEGGDIELALQHFKCGMTANNKDANMMQLTYSRGYCGYGFCKVMSEQIRSNPQRYNEKSYQSILIGSGLILQISLKEERNESQRKKIEKMQESATKHIAKLDLVKKIESLKESAQYKAMEALD